MVKNLGHLIQPLLTLILGGVVLFIILAVFLPYHPDDHQPGRPVVFRLRGLPRVNCPDRESSSSGVTGTGRAHPRQPIREVWRGGVPVRGPPASGRARPK